MIFAKDNYLRMSKTKIIESVKVSELKQTFNTKFPFLKIEFFKKKHKNLSGSAKKDLILDDFSIIFSQEDLANLINEDVTVSEFEKQFNDKLKLSVQVFRKSGKSWLETTFTDGWTLKKQNQEGIDLSQI